MLMKRNVLLRDAETNAWLSNHLELYPVYSEEGTLYSGNIQKLEITHTTFLSNLNAFIAYLSGDGAKKFTGLKLAVRVNNAHYITVNVKTMGDKSLIELLLNNWSGKVPTITIYGTERPNMEAMMKNKRFELYLMEKMDGLHKYLKAITVSFSKEHVIPNNWQGKTYENKLMSFPQDMQVNLADVDYNYVN